MTGWQSCLDQTAARRCWYSCVPDRTSKFGLACESLNHCCRASISGRAAAIAAVLRICLATTGSMSVRAATVVSAMAPHHGRPDVACANSSNVWKPELKSQTPSRAATRAACSAASAAAIAWEGSNCCWMATATSATAEEGVEEAGAEVEEVERMSAADGVWNESMVLRALVMASSPSFVSLSLFPPKPKANPRLRAGAAEP